MFKVKAKMKSLKVAKSKDENSKVLPCSIKLISCF